MLNGEVISRQIVQKGMNDICIARGLNKKDTNNIKVLKDTHTRQDKTHILQVYSLMSDGIFVPINRSKFKIEFIGDSITCGSGTVGKATEMSYMPAFSCGYHSYAFMLGKFFNADISVVAQGGFGIYHNGYGDVTKAIPLYYEQIAGVFEGDIAKQLYKFDFDPDVIIINLGTNDEKNIDTSVECYIQQFISLVRKNNPHAFILWIYGMMRISLTDYIKAAIKAYIEETGDEEVHFLDVSPAVQIDKGSVNHPSRLTHRSVAAFVARYLKRYF